jgi:membrane protease YdiL (CAAX protease family)
VEIRRASFVGVVYGLAAVYTTDLAVPVIAHSLANLVAAYLWRIEEDSKSMKSK